MFSFKRLSLTLALLTTMIAPAQGAIITAGEWKDTPVISNAGDTPYANVSWDCTECNIGYYALTLGFNIEQAQYLHAKFTLEGGDTGPTFRGLTAHTNNQLILLASGALQLTTDRGDVFLSDGDGWEQFVVFRWMNEGVEAFTALIAFEDLPSCVVEFDPTKTDCDYNDGIKIHTDQPTTRRVPEPAVIALFGMGLLGWARKGRRRGSA